MSSVKDGLSPIFKDLDVLDLVFTQGIESSGHVTSVSQKALMLLSVLYQTLIDLDRQNLENPRQVCELSDDLAIGLALLALLCGT